MFQKFSVSLKNVRENIALENVSKVECMIRAALIKGQNNNNKKNLNQGAADFIWCIYRLSICFMNSHWPC